MRSRKIAITITVVALSFRSSATDIDFRRDVKPIFESRCYSCHGASQQMGGLRFDQRQSAVGRAIVPGKSSESRIIDRITSAAEGFRMPLTGPPLSADQILVLKLWINTGANWPDEITGSGIFGSGTDPNADALFAAVRNGDAAHVRELLKNRKLSNARDNSGATPLMWASLYAGPRIIELLLRAGANPNIQNATGATALMWAVGDVTKVKSLLAAGADINARSESGNTALLIAAATSRSRRVIEELLRRGADIDARNADGDTALVYAAAYGDKIAVNALLARHATVEPGGSILTPVTAAAYYANVDMLKMLFASGGRINSQDCCATALFWPAAFGDKGTVKFLLQNGADVNFHSTKKILSSSTVGTPLMWAAYAEAQDPELVAMLIGKGADVNARTVEGETALSRAAPRGHTAVVDMLLKGHGIDLSPPTFSSSVSRLNVISDVRSAVERSLALLLTSSAVWYKNRVCVSCHNQSLPAVAVALGREHGFRVDERAAAEQSAKTSALLANTRESLLQMMTANPGVPGGAHSAGYAMFALSAEKHPADETTEALVRFIGAKQLQNGRWRPDAPRPPLEYSDITATALCLRALKLYGEGRRTREYTNGVESARHWLLTAQPRFHEERAFKLLGLRWAGSNRSEIQKLSAALLSEQREDGGWSQLRTLESDAYATGQALYALHESGLATSDPAYQRGVRFLLDTQSEDGSWHIRSRSFAIQPYFESGFPYGRDQFISAAGTSWAAMALSLTGER